MFQSTKIQANKRHKRGQRGGKKVRARNLRRLQITIYRPTYKPPEPELIDLTLSDSEDETVILPPLPPEYEILDTRRSIRVRSHEEIPIEVLVSFVQGYHRCATSAFIPDTVVNWCKFKFETQ